MVDQFPGAVFALVPMVNANCTKLLLHQQGPLPKSGKTQLRRYIMFFKNKPSRTQKNQKNDRNRRRRRFLSFESLEHRYAFSADLIHAGQMFDAHDLEHHDIGGFHVDPIIDLTNQHADPVNPQNTLSTPTPTSLADTFRLHSNVGALKRIHLDFDGNVTSGTMWNSSFAGGTNIVSSAFDLDGNAASFSDLERQRIQLIWERVSEDFIPFNVDVTTEDPGTAALTNSGGSDTEWGIRVVVGGSSYDWYGYAAGGTGYEGSFNWSSDTPVFVFPAQLGGGDEKYTSEAISHETGHALGLSHDGRSSPVEEYYHGQGSGNAGWAPIMGGSYYQNVTQWSKGEYLYANQTQDDLTIITTQNGFSYRNDDRGNSVGTASLLQTSGTSISDWGIIERTNDVDVFSFWTGDGIVSLNVSPIDRGPNLDVFLSLYDAANNLIVSSNPADLLGASINATLPASQYYLRVSGTGNGDPALNGYSNYASLGQYFISGTIVQAQTDFLSIAASNTSQIEGNTGSSPYTFTVNRGGSISGSTTVAFSVIGSGTNPADASDFQNAILPSGSVAFAAGETSKTITVWITGDVSIEKDEAFSVVLSNASGTSVISTATVTGLSVNDDIAGVTVTPTSGLLTSESGTTAKFTVVLTIQPTSDVTIQVTSLDTTEGRVSTSLLRFTTSNWNVAQTVTVTGVDDTIRDGNITYLVDLAATQSADLNYNGIQVADVQVTNQDNERASGKKGDVVVGSFTNQQATDLFMAQVATNRNGSSGSSSERNQELVLENQRGETRTQIHGVRYNAVSPNLTGNRSTSPAAVPTCQSNQNRVVSRITNMDLHALDAVFSDLAFA